VGSRGVAAIHLAAGKETEKNTRCLKMLLQYGANPNIKSSEGLTPLHITALWGCYQNLKLLLMNGGNPNSKDNEGNTPGQLAVQQENRKCAQLLQEYMGSSLLKNFIMGNFSRHPWNNSTSHWASERPSILSSTRMSAAGLAADLCSHDDVLTSKANELAAASHSKISPSKRDTLPAFPARQASRKSVSFRDVDEYFPVFSPESPRKQPAVNGSHLPFNLSEYSGFLDAERMATVLHTQGIDVTSPDHIYIFCRESSESTEEDMEKTVVSHYALKESDDENEACFDSGSSSSGTGSSHYSSCDSDNYTSYLPGVLHKLSVSESNHPNNDGSKACSDPADDTSSEAGVDQKVHVAAELQDDFDLTFTPSPFVTGRTRSRLSRCSTSRTPESLLVKSSLFEDTLPTPVRTRRQTPRSHSTESVYSSPRVPCCTPSYSGSSTGGSLSADCQDIKDDAWISEDCSSQLDSVSASSSSSCFSPKGSSEDSDFPCTPGTGCTPRYSMSRLSSCHRPQHLANLSYTPGGRPHILDLDEPVDYLYTDTEQGHKLIETHVPPTANTSLNSSMSTSKTKGMTDRELRLRLVELGESPGPISSRTRPTYMRRLRCLLQESHLPSPNHQKQSDQSQTGYSPELCRVLCTFELPDCQAEEQALCQQFDHPDQNRKWREGIIKSSFNYLLLDPRVTKNLPFRSRTMTPQECFQTFIRAILYVGKGKRSRPYSHLYEALEYYRGDKMSKKLCPKVQQILQVWKAEQGVISLHCFQNVIPVEAYTREACMVEAVGLKMLTNQKRGDFYGVVSNWPVRKKRELGVHLLYRAMQIFLAEGERQLRPLDIRQ
uniref:LEM domain-containing protein n=1 Tax=Mola mola TaxID=94237 RepID=A0A3Q4B155_MOLML